VNAASLLIAKVKRNWQSFFHSRLFRKYAALFVSVVCVAVLSNGMLEIWFSYREQKTALVRLQHEQAKAVAAEIGHFFKELVGQIGWTTQLPWSVGADQRRIDAIRLLRQAWAITEVSLFDSSGRERLRISRIGLDVVDSGLDISKERKFIDAVANRIYYGPVYFRRGTEPYMTMAAAEQRADFGVVVAEVNLKHILDVISGIKVGQRGKAYVVDARGILIAHPDISLVLRRTDMSRLAHVRAVINKDSDLALDSVTRDLQGQSVLTASAPIPAQGGQRPALDWLVFVELPAGEAYQPIYAAVQRSGLSLLGALGLALLAGLFLARKVVTPIQALRAGAERIGTGDLGQRFSIKTGDEIEALGDQFNKMTAQLQDSYATLERKVEERTHQLELANLAKSRFLAAASHDLRQPLHALGLFVAQLRSRMKPAERHRIVERIDTAVGAMNELFDALLDISKLDAGVLVSNPTNFPVAGLLKRIDMNFADAAREKGLKLRIVPTEAWVRSDFILLQRIVSNLVSNAIRYTGKGGVVVGCRRRGATLRIEVWDSGAGIPPDQQRKVFTEFYRVPDRSNGEQGGLGLGLAIVDRLCALLGHSVELASTPGKGSRFSLLVPLVSAADAASEEAAKSPLALLDASQGKLVVVIDDDPLVLEGMRGLLRSWGAHVVTGNSAEAVLARLPADEHRPDLIISDYQLMNGMTGIEAIARLRGEWGPIPAFLISGDTAPGRLREARASGHHLLHKPVAPMTLRTIMNQLLKKTSEVAN
jgi:signal transduction histidine kinase/CheY-like chemotaxis protein